MTDKELEEFQQSTFEHIVDLIDMIKRVDSHQKIIPQSELSELLHTSKQKLDIYYRYVQIDIAIEHARRYNNGTR